ncbi:MAG: hypothetical protein NTAFB01_22120 [Nitrospira sp.]
MGRIAWEIHQFYKGHHRRNPYIREDRRPLTSDAGSATMPTRRWMEWAAIKNSCILAKQLFDFIP